MCGVRAGGATPCVRTALGVGPEHAEEVVDIEPALLKVRAPGRVEVAYPVLVGRGKNRTHLRGPCAWSRLVKWFGHGNV